MLEKIEAEYDKVKNKTKKNIEDRKISIDEEFDISMIAKSLVKQFFEINKIEENLDRAILRSILEYLKTNDLLKHLIVYLSEI